MRLTLRTAKMAFTTRGIALVLIGGLLIDSVVRNFATLTSEYYRLIGVPGWAFGFIGSAIAVGNWFVPSIAARVNRRFSPVVLLSLAGGLAVVGLFLLAPAWPWVGLIPAVGLMLLLGFVSFTVSRYLHGVAESSQRATLLSVKGLVFNLGYGTCSLGFSWLLASLGRHREGVFQHALLWQAVFLAVALLIYVVATRWGGKKG